MIAVARQPAAIRALALAIGLLLCSAGQAVRPPSTAASVVVRLSAGEGASIFDASPGPQSRELRLGMALSPSIPGLEVQATGDRQALKICCDRDAAQGTGLQCQTERSISLGDRAQDVRSRYGPPTSAQSGVLSYPGLRFELDGQQTVKRMCVVPR